MSIKYTAEHLAQVLGLFAPTPEQKAIIEAVQKPALVVAGAGSGKTETMASRFVYLVANNLAQPDKILGLTFTRKAAAELRDRVMRRLRALEKAGLWKPDEHDRILGLQPVVSTYNAYSAGLVKDYGYLLGASPDLTLIGEAQRRMIIEELVGNFPTSPDNDEFSAHAVSTLVEATSGLASSLGDHNLSPEDARGKLNQMVDQINSGKTYATMKTILGRLNTRAALMELVSQYQQYKQDHGLIDFSDQVALAHQILSQYPKIAQREADLYSDILLDEFQDTSVIQLELLATVFAGKSVTAVGDPLQAIYGWRGASSAALETFERRFGAGETVETFTLSTSWRNDQAILDTANEVAKELRPISAEQRLSPESNGVDVDQLTGDNRVRSPKLQARAEGTGGQVDFAYLMNAEDEAQAVAQWIKNKHDVYQKAHANSGSRKLPSTAILCRKRADMEGLMRACQDLGLPTAVLGTGGLLAEPIIQDLVAGLQVAEDASKASALLRLLTKWNVSPADIYTLAQWAKRDRVKGVSAATATIIDVVDGLKNLRSESTVESTVESTASEQKTNNRLSDEAYDRCVQIASQVRQVRRTAGLPLIDRVRAAIRSFNLDVEAMVHPHESTSMNALDRFLTLTQEFMDSHAHATVSQLLVWLEVAAEEERGFEGVAADPVPDAVNILTIHAAKGLEWDYVAVPSLNEGDFPGKDTRRAQDNTKPKASGWLLNISELPYPLRGDREYLPQWEWVPPESAAAEKSQLEDYKEKLGIHALREERRLAYVAFTRARHGMLLTGSYLNQRRTGATSMSVFLRAAIARSDVKPLELEGLEAGIAPEPTESDKEAYQESLSGQYWPSPRSELQKRAHQIAQMVTAKLNSSGGDLEAEVRAAIRGSGQQSKAQIEQAWHDVKLLLDEQAAQYEQTKVVLPLYVSTATGLPNLVTDRDETLLNLRRPMPSVTTESTHLGTTFHAWAENQLRISSPLLLDEDGQPSKSVLTPEGEAKLEQWKRNFQELDLWDEYDPLEVENEYVVRVNNVQVICRIDAVLKSRETGKILLIDWKTGHQPKKSEYLMHYAMQLHLYLLAYSTKHGIPVSELEAALVFVGDGGKTVSYSELLAQGVFNQDPDTLLAEALS